MERKAPTQTEQIVQFKILMKAQYKEMVTGNIYLVNERQALDLEALGYARILERIEYEEPKQTVTREGKQVETAKVSSGSRRH